MNENEKAIVESNLRKLEQGITQRKLQIASLKKEIELLDTFEPAKFAKTEPEFLYENEPVWLDFSKDMTLKYKQMNLDLHEGTLAVDEKGLATEKAKLSLAEEGIPVSSNEPKEEVDDGKTEE